MKIILTLFFGVLAVGATLYSGLLHGRIRHEFGLGQDLTEQIRLVESLPKEFGQTEDGQPAWVMVGEQQPMSEEVIELLECVGYFQAAYRSTANPEWVVALLIMVGPSGPLLVHSPDVCYPATGNVFLSGPEAIEIDLSSGGTAELATMTFKRPSLDARIVRVAYSFSTGGEWGSPENPRQRYAGSPFLYKLQLQTLLPSEYQLPEGRDPLADFMQDFSSMRLIATEVSLID